MGHGLKYRIAPRSRIEPASPRVKPGDRPRFPGDKKIRWRAAVIGMGAALVVTACARALAYAPDWLEDHYVNGMGERVARGLAAMASLAPFSIIEPLLALFACWMVFPAAPAIYAVARRRRAASNAIACGALRTAMIAGAVMVAFYIAWGFNYSRAALPARLGWDDANLAALPRMGTVKDRDELAALCAQLVFITNVYYEQAMGRADANEHSVPSISIADMDRTLDEGYRRAAKLLHLDPTFAKGRGPAKPVVASRILSDLGIAGFYSPWTGEANYNTEIPPFQLPLTIAHEKAHQRCVASEDEANFHGYLACVLSDDCYARYSGYLFAQRQLLAELVQIDPEAARTIISLRSSGVQSDVIYSQMFWRIFGGSAQALSHAVNDAYLKANRVDGGTLSYQMSARLLVLFARHNDGSCIVQESDVGP